MSKQDLIATLKSLDALTSDQKSYLIDLVNTKKKYGLVWEDKPEDVEELLRQKLPVLDEVVERRIRAVLGGKEDGGKEKRSFGPSDSKNGQQAAIVFAEKAPADSPVRECCFVTKQHSRRG